MCGNPHCAVTLVCLPISERSKEVDLWFSNTHIHFTPSISWLNLKTWTRASKLTDSTILTSTGTITLYCMQPIFPISRETFPLSPSFPFLPAAPMGLLLLRYWNWHRTEEMRAASGQFPASGRSPSTRSEEYPSPASSPWSAKHNSLCCTIRSSVGRLS